MRSTSELQSIAREIVAKSKKSAHVDTGRLKRSISYVINLQGIPTFTEVFYGQFGDNSDLEENLKAMWPRDEPYNLIWVDDNGNPYQVIRKTAGGRIGIETKATKATTRKSLGINGIKNFLKSFNNGKTQDTSADNSGQSNQEKS
jgi:hypothetical protein